jgi:hypothetical protein
MSATSNSVQGQRLRRAAEAAFSRWPSFTCLSAQVEHDRGGSVEWSNGIVRITIWADWTEGEFGVWLSGADVTVGFEQVVPDASKRLTRIPRDAKAGQIQARIEAVLERLASDAPELLTGEQPAAEQRLRRSVR